LSSSKDEYLILPSCLQDNEYSITINLSEDVTIDTIVITNYEEYSDNPREFELMGSIDYPTTNWV
jgi:hypothetical protein